MDTGLRRYDELVEAWLFLALVRLDVLFQTHSLFLRRALLGERSSVEVAVLGGFDLRLGAHLCLAPLAEVYEFGHAGLPSPPAALSRAFR